MDINVKLTDEQAQTILGALDAMYDAISTLEASYDAKTFLRKQVISAQVPVELAVKLVQHHEMLKGTADMDA